MIERAIPPLGASYGKFRAACTPDARLLDLNRLPAFAYSHTLLIWRRLLLLPPFRSERQPRLSVKPKSPAPQKKGRSLKKRPGQFGEETE